MHRNYSATFTKPEIFAVLPISRAVLLAFQVDAIYTRIVWEATLDKIQQSQCVFLSLALLNQ